MKKTTIKLTTINDVKAFVNVCTPCDFDIDLSSGRYTINAKSIMGIFSLDLASPLVVSVEAEGDKVDAFFEAIKSYVTSQEG